MSQTAHSTKFEYHRDTQHEIYQQIADAQAPYIGAPPRQLLLGLLPFRQTELAKRLRQATCTLRLAGKVPSLYRSNPTTS